MVLFPSISNQNRVRLWQRDKLEFWYGRELMRLQYCRRNSLTSRFPLPFDESIHDVANDAKEFYEGKDEDQED